MAGESCTGAEISGLVNTLQGHVDDIRTVLQCGICIRPLYEPFTLACGHTFCYTCLSSWFSGGRSKRTCPDCRAPVKTQPAPAYLVRAVVQMFTSRAELLDKGETTAEHLTHRQEESGRLDKDKSNTDPQNGGLFGGLFKPKPPPLHPIVDVDDGVMRCPQCNWELADDEVCAGCGYEYHGESDGTDYTDESDDFSETENYDSIIDDEADEDGFGGIDDDHLVWGDFAVPGSWPRGHNAIGLSWQDGLPTLYHPGSHLPSFRLPPRPPGVIHTDPSEYDDHYDGEENEYEMDSFIDDEEHQNREADDLQSEHSTVDASRGWQPENPPRPPIVLSGTITSDEDEDDEDDEEDSVVGPRNRRPMGRAFTTHFTTHSLEDSEAEDGEEEDLEEDSEEDEDSLMVPQQPRGVASSHGDRYQESMSHPMSTDFSEEGEEESESSDPSSPPPRRPARPARTTGVSVGNAITIDDSDEEQPVGPVRRTAQRRHARFSPY